MDIRDIELNEGWGIITVRRGDEPEPKCFGEHPTGGIVPECLICAWELKCEEEAEKGGA